jgi:hypothetical protein
MKIIYLLLYIAAAACFGVAAFAGRSTLGAKGGGRGGNVNLLAAGLFFWVLVPLLVQLQTVDDPA